MKEKIINFLKNSKKYGLIKIKKEPFWSNCILLTENIRNSNKCQEIVYIITNNILTKQLCPICNKELKFRSIKYGYEKTCGSKECYRKNLSLKVKNAYTKNIKEKISIKSKAYWNSISKEQKSEYIKKIAKTKLIRYNNSNYNNFNKARKTFINKYDGIGFGSKIIANKANETIKKRYGNKESINNKIKSTMLYRYNKICYSKTDSFKDLYKDLNWVKLNIQKCYNTKKINKTFNTSSDEENCYISLKEKYNNVIRQYKDNRYPFACDFYIPELDLFIECNFSWTHGFSPYVKSNFADNEKLKVWIEKSKQSKYYNNAIHTWTIRDVNKRNIAKENNLNYIEFFNIEEFNKWLMN